MLANILNDFAFYKRVLLAKFGVAVRYYKDELAFYLNQDNVFESTHTKSQKETKTLEISRLNTQFID